MALFFRAIVMLAVLVGLPAAWVYYGPLPASAQRFADRVVEIGRESFAEETAVPGEVKGITAPRYAFSPEPVRYDPQVTAASFSSTPEIPRKNNSLQDHLEPHLAVLRKLGATEYSLENWGQDEQLVRFRCAVSIGENKDFSRQFEAVAADSLGAVRQIVGEVSAWQNARGGDTLWR